MAKKRKQRMLSILCLSAMTCPLLACQSSGAQESDNPAIVANQVETGAQLLLNQSLPDFMVTNNKGEEISSQDFQGKPTVIVDWASWCPDCQAYLPTVQNLYEEYGDRVNFVMINLTDGLRETREQAQAYLAEEGYTFPTFFDEGEVAADVLKVEYIPTTYIVDSDLRVREVFERGPDEKGLKAAIESIL